MAKTGYKKEEKKMSRLREKTTATLLIAIFMISAIPFAFALTVSTDKASYQREETIILSVSGLTPDKTVMVQFKDSVEEVWTEQNESDSNGNFQYQLKIPSSWRTGTYTITVKDLDADTTKTTTFRIYTPSVASVLNTPPVAEAGPDQKAWVGESIYFDGSDSYDPDGYLVSWDWSFGDGATASGEKVSHEYSEPGNYTVTLTVKDVREEAVSDTCTVEISEPPAPVSDIISEQVAGGEEGYVVDAVDEANTTVTLDTIAPVTVTVLKYEGNPHPGDPIPASALPIYVDIEVSDPDAVIWPIYVEVSYTDEQIGELDENTFGIYYWMDDAWQRCSNTGVDTERNVVWAYMTAHEASGSPILIAGIHAIPTPPLPPFLSDLTVTPPELEQGDDVTISLDIMNPNNQTITYMVTMQIGELTLLVNVELEAYESKTISRTITMYTAGDFSVTVDGMTGSFTVEAPEIPLKPAEFVVSDLSITPEEAELWEGIDVWTFKITVDVKNIGEQTGSYTVDLKVEGEVIESGTVTLGGEEETPITFSVTRGAGSYTVEVDGLTGSFAVNPYIRPLEPAEFVVSDLSATPEVEEGEDVTFSVKVTNIGETEGSYTLELKVDGETIETETITLARGASTTVSFDETWDAGTYQVNVEDLTETFTVSKKPITPVWMRPGYAAGILIVIASAGAIIYLTWKRKLRPTISSDTK